MNYQEQVDTMVAHMAKHFTVDQMATLAMAFGKGLAKCSSLIAANGVRIDFLNVVAKAVALDSAVMSKKLNDMGQRDEITIAVFFDSLRRGK